MTAKTERWIRERLVSNFVDRNPKLELVLNRPSYTTTAVGGKVVGTTEVLEVQTFGIMPFKRRLTIEYGLESQIRGRNQFTDIHFILICANDADIAQDDYFDWTAEGDLAPGRYTVAFIGARMHDQKLAPIRYRGQDAS